MFKHGPGGEGMVHGPKIAGWLSNIAAPQPTVSTNLYYCVTLQITKTISR